jgi:hypothetical protein
MASKKPKKLFCEVCLYDIPAALHLHHIIPRCDSRSTNHSNNLAVLCATCHNLVHSGDITIIGVYSSTTPTGRKLMFFKKGEEPPLERKYWKVLPEDNPMVVRGPYLRP